MTTMESNINFRNDGQVEESFSGEDGKIPIFDYSNLVSFDPSLRSQAVDNLGRLCLHYGFFIVTNHSIPGCVIEGVIEKVFEFFNLPEDEKNKYNTNFPTDMIRFGKVSREFVKMAVHPQFHCPSNPPALSEITQEYSQRVREVGMELLRGMSRALGLEEEYIEKKMELKSGYDFLTANDYPPLQNYEKQMIGQAPHVDPSLLVFIIENVSGGLQVHHHGKWLNVDLKPGWILVNVADHLEILTNGKYKSVVHRVIVNNEARRRVTLPMFMGPSLNTVVSPAQEVVDETHPPAYGSITYKQYLEFNEFHLIDGKSCLHQIRL